jgi:hypothetical protein
MPGPELLTKVIERQVHGLIVRDFASLLAFSRLRITFGPSAVRFAMNSRAKSDAKMAGRAETEPETGVARHQRDARC